MDADDPLEKKRLKASHAKIFNDTQILKKEIPQYLSISAIPEVNQQQVTDNYYQVKLIPIS